MKCTGKCTERVVSLGLGALLLLGPGAAGIVFWSLAWADELSLVYSINQELVGISVVATLIVDADGADALGCGKWPGLSKIAMQLSRTFAMDG